MLLFMAINHAIALPYIFMCICYPSRASTARRSDPNRSLPLTTLMPIVLLLCLYFTARPLTQSAGARTQTRWRRWERAKDVSSTPIRSHNNGAHSPLKPQAQHALDDNTIKRNVNRQRTQVPRALCSRRSLSGVIGQQLVGISIYKLYFIHNYT